MKHTETPKEKKDFTKIPGYILLTPAILSIPLMLLKFITQYASEI
jgi:hypothetical protein